jgi:DNA-binding NarL/FixJ family response regulator
MAPGLSWSCRCRGIVMNARDDRTTVLIVDDHALVREGLCGILEAQEDMRVVGEAGDSAATVALAAQQRPDIVLLDIEIPGGEVTVTVARIRECSPGSRVIILSMYEGPQLVQDLLAAGVRGYLLKSIHWQELVVAIRAVRADSDRVVLGVSRESLRHVHQVSAAGTLSAREREILDLVGQALSNGQIAARLGLTEATVKRHLRNIFIKLGAVSRIDAVNKGASELPPRTTYPGAPGRPLQREQPRQPGAYFGSEADARHRGVHFQMRGAAGARHGHDVVALRQ